ncbi:hypothetical protein CL617_01260 [archaeon]|nr:hypothetical protein [archaeon]|tara:strand:+ start:3323 stop:4126 length:804 start_codon:yes stop_codon:yes gene_type:complete
MLEKKQVLESLKLVREFSKKRNFNQTVDLVINVTGINPKKQEEAVDLFITLPKSRNKQVKLCAFVEKNLEEKAKVFDKVIVKEEFANLSAKEIKVIAKEHNFFIAQVSVMPQIASTFGKVLGPLGKMPSPKIGCVINPDSDLEALKKRLQNIVRVRTRNELIIKVGIGTEEMKDEELLENINLIYNNITGSLPQEASNIKNVNLKLTMGSLVRIGAKKEEVQKSIEERKKSKTKKKDKKETKKSKETKEEKKPTKKKETKKKEAKKK